MAVLERLYRVQPELLAVSEKDANVRYEGGLLVSDATNRGNFPAGFYPRGLALVETTQGGESGFFAPYLDLDNATYDGQSDLDEQSISNVTRALDSEDFVNGSYSEKLTIGSAFTTGIVASKVVSDTDYTASTHLLFWIKSSVATAAGDIVLKISESANLGGSPKSFNVPALKANEWTLCCVASGTMTGLDHIISFGVVLATDLGAMVIRLGDVRSMKATTPAGVGVLADDCYFDPSKTNNNQNINGQSGFQGRAIVHGSVFKNNIIGYDSGFKTDVDGTLTANSTILDY